MTAGTHSVKVEYYENGGDATAIASLDNRREYCSRPTSVRRISRIMCGWRHGSRLVFAAWALMALVLFTLLLTRSIRVLGGGPTLGPDKRKQSSAFLVSARLGKPGRG